MSIEMSSYADSQKLISATQWKEAIMKLGYNVEIDDEIDMKEFSGYLPVLHNGQQSGFEYYFDIVKDEEITELKLPYQKCIAITLRTGSDFDELACATAAIAGFCIATEGIIHEPIEDIFIGHTECKDWAEKEYKSSISLLTNETKSEKKPWWKFW